MKTLGRIGVALVKALFERHGPEPGVLLIVPRREREALKENGLLHHFFVRAKAMGWTTRMVGMTPEAHGRRQRNAEKAVGRASTSARSTTAGFLTTERPVPVWR